MIFFFYSNSYELLKCSKKSTYTNYNIIDNNTSIELRKINGVTMINIKSYGIEWKEKQYFDLNLGNNVDRIIK